MPTSPSILVVSTSVDTHADAIRWGLQQFGLRSSLWDFSEFPESRQAGIWIPQEGSSLCRLGDSNDAICGPFDVVWMRRLFKPKPMPNCHKDDLDVVKRESERFMGAALSQLGHKNTLWVNHPDDDRRADCKATQLLLARQIGLKIPDTYIGNSPVSVRRFYELHRGEIIYKAFRPATWVNEDESVTVLRTSRLSAEDVSVDYAMLACPGIYQVLVLKQYELRITVIGYAVYAVKIDSQAERRTVDWRYDFSPTEVPYVRCDLPEALAEKCIQLCRMLRLQFATIDIVLDQDGDFVFLDLNCAGQFLFVEDALPDELMLDRFCRFLSGDARGGGQTAALRLPDYYDSSSFSELREREKLVVDRRVERV